MTSRLDYCNSLLNGVPDYKLKRVQRMQNIAARIVSRCPYRDHITPVLESLHWLPVKYRILFKLLLLTYKCLNGLGPGYLSCLVMPLKHKEGDLFIGRQEFVVGYSKAPEQPQSSARPICHSHAMTRSGREPATIRIAA